MGGDVEGEFEFVEAGSAATDPVTTPVMIEVVVLMGMVVVVVVVVAAVALTFVTFVVCLLFADRLCFM